ncbi:quinone-dependent dihydroorotate dehydrogenase [Natronobacterium gregoryi]|uniref:Dihydroorotate dehydrogenase (quinone) n=2 Tax=Natronobacterium gregoryi TaxID=44930 RepID=L0ALU7_NATGS|nr:quinone-dependent dihydroorotate dehydrogenase [Natronobacterium gregoryi]AFZ74132.1 dihydroorotate dehydrogenase, subfamily 2 [Natronobacterium gregoryi SP2]ELY63869.1 dihydroorotate dehydrogenase 2 [Natronobacterium gregoryi SP2]PLK22073.1 quinone-dependent dihydroorotate dehydrogenase [Natronobacterium gregoryi SP2]SFI50052.1 dihydroorotate oxidase A [Natronobacterium gregoryi]
MTLYSRVRPLVFKLPPERAHNLVKNVLRPAQATRPSRAALSYAFRYEHPALEVDAFGSTYPNPVGVAAGFDKNAEMTHALAALGFGFVEIGTVTPYPQDGNDRPRMFRLPEDKAAINRMGFNNQGMERIKERLESDGTPNVPLGVNVGKMNSSDEDEAIEDYRRVFNRLSSFADYVAVNVSCPNTPDEFDETSPEHLERIVDAIEAENDRDIPILVKIGPDSPDESILDLVDVVRDLEVDGIIATNSSTSRDGLESPKRDEWGGLSGKPIENRSTAVVRAIAEHTDGELPIMGVGGVDSAESAYEKIRAGASLVQLYTGFAYGGPSTAKQINRGLVDLLERDGFSSVEEAVGADLE